MTLVLDAGALIAAERGDRDVVSRLRMAFRNGDEVHVPAGVVGQAWRNPARQAVLARILKQCDEIPLDGPTARLCGELCQQTETADVIDASVAVAVADASRYRGGVTLLTSDRRDMRVLLTALETGAHVVGV